MAKIYLINTSSFECDIQVDFFLFNNETTDNRNYFVYTAIRHCYLTNGKYYKFDSLDGTLYSVLHSDCLAYLIIQIPL